MEVLNLVRLFWGWGFPYISLTYILRTAYIGEYLYFRYLKCLVIDGHPILGNFRIVMVVISSWMPAT